MSATFQSFIITKSGHWTENWVGMHQPQTVFLKLFNLYVHHFLFAWKWLQITDWEKFNVNIHLWGFFPPLDYQSKPGKFQSVRC